MKHQLFGSAATAAISWWAKKRRKFVLCAAIRRLISRLKRKTIDSLKPLWRGFLLEAPLFLGFFRPLYTAFVWVYNK